MDLNLPPSWEKHLKSEFEKPYFKNLLHFLDQEYAQYTIYPRREEIFAAFNLCDFEQTKVVILGQDPYHGVNQAHGLSFSVQEGVKFPPSLRNIFKERNTDLGLQVPVSGNLTGWAKQGVLLLNATLTVRASAPGSHQGKGWEKFTDKVIEVLSDQKSHLVFILWGAYAQKKGAIVDEKKHLILKSAHPSPFAARKGFFGNRHFSQANQYLAQYGIAPVSW